MFKNVSAKKLVFSGFIILVPLNILAYYLITQSIGIRDAMQHVDNQRALESLSQKSSFYNIFSAVVITLDLVFVLVLLFILFKTFTKSLKNSQQS